MEESLSSVASPSLVAIHVLVAIHPCHLRLASRRLRHCGPRPRECGRVHRSVLKVKLVGCTCEEEILFLVGSPSLEVSLGEVGSLSLGENPSCNIS